MKSIPSLYDIIKPDETFEFIQKRYEHFDTSKGIVLYVENLNVSFDGFKALNDLSLYIDEGELRCVIGANGAGKTTFMDVITGKTRSDSGSAYFGQYINLLNKSEDEISSLGIGRKFQKPSVFEALTVFENLELSLKTKKTVINSMLAKLNDEQFDRINEVLKTIGLNRQRDQLAGVLSHGQKQWLEIGMLLMADPRLLLVDEPVAGMTMQEIERTAELLNALAGEHTVVVIEHDMEFIRSIARKVTVLHQGSVLAEGSMDQIQNNPDVIDVYLGEGLEKQQENSG